MQTFAVVLDRFIWPIIDKYVGNIVKNITSPRLECNSPADMHSKPCVCYQLFCKPFHGAPKYPPPYRAETQADPTETMKGEFDQEVLSQEPRHEASEGQKN